MKKLFSIAICAIVLLSVKNLQAQTKVKGFAGTLKFAISYPGAEKDPIAQGAPSETSTKISGTKMRTVISIPNYSKSDIVDFSANTTLRLIEMMGQKFAIPMNSAQVDSMKKTETPLKITETKETKVIAGYTCTKYTAEDEDGTIFTGFFTKEIVGDFDNWNSPFKGIKGMAFEYEMPSQGGSMKFTATEVKKEAIADSEFTIPEGYKVTTDAELKAFIEKQRSGK